MNDLDGRIRAALHAAVDGVREQDLRPAQPPRTVPNERRRAIRWAAPLLAAAAVIAVVVATLALSGSPSATKKLQPVGPGPTATTVTATPKSDGGTPCGFADAGGGIACDQVTPCQ